MTTDIIERHPWDCHRVAGTAATLAGLVYRFDFLKYLMTGNRHLPVLQASGID
jgi:hypothetical protein